MEPKQLIISNLKTTVNINSETRKTQCINYRNNHLTYSNNHKFNFDHNSNKEGYNHLSRCKHLYNNPSNKDKKKMITL